VTTQNSFASPHGSHQNCSVGELVLFRTSVRAKSSQTIPKTVPGIIGFMAYDQTQRRDEASWSQEDEEYKRRASFAPVVVCGSGAEQALRITSPLSGPGVYTQRWPQVPAYAQPHGAYYPNRGYQQTLPPGHNTIGSSVYQSHSNAVVYSQSAPVPSYGYTMPQPYANPYEYVYATR
jgi:hypothetical protein